MKGSDLSALSRLHPGIANVIRDAGWPGFSPIQRAAFGPVLSGADILIEAPTAGGKTEAVLFPALTRTAESSGSGLRILYLAPLRALLNNLQERGNTYAEACGLSAFKWHGDVDQRAKLEALRYHPDLLLTTPESVEAILLRKPGWSEFFRNLHCVIVDEAHNFAAGDRGGHLASLLQRIESATAGPPQRVGLSATVGNPEGLLAWLAGGNRSLGQHVRVAGTPPERAVSVEHFGGEAECESTPPEDRAVVRRFHALAESLRGKRAIVFVPSRAKAEQLAKAFVRVEASGGLSVRVRTHHSNVSKYFREEAEKLIACSSEDGIGAIISTSTLELGIDIGELDLVGQVDALASSSSFLQRLGRTGRRSGRAQVFRGYTLTERDLLLLTGTVALGLKGCAEPLRLPTKCYHLLAHQLLCLTLQYHGVAADAAWKILRSAHCFSAVERLQFDDLVRYMCEQDFLRNTGGVLVAGDATEKYFLGAGWRRLFAVFDTAPMYEVVHGKLHVGTLSVGFVEALEAPFFFVLGGRLWQAVQVDRKAHRVAARPAKEGEAPKWEMVGGLDVPFETAQEVGRILHLGPIPFFVNQEGRERLEWLQARIRNIEWRPGRVLVRPAGARKTKVLTYAGDRINRTLALSLELLMGGAASANYSEVTFDPPGDSDGRTTESVNAALLELRQGTSGDAERLNADLSRRRPCFPFSPFSRCLPQNLLAEALAERTLDVEGLLQLLAVDAGAGFGG